MWNARVRSGLAPVLPHGIRIYAVGDIHGRSDLLVRLLCSIDADCRRRPVNQPSLFLSATTSTEGLLRAMCLTS